MKIEIKKHEDPLPYVKDLPPGTEYMASSGEKYMRVSGFQADCPNTLDLQTFKVISCGSAYRPNKILSGPATKPPIREFILTLSEEEVVHVRDSIGSFPAKIVGRDLYVALTNAIN